MLLFFACEDLSVALPCTVTDIILLRPVQVEYPAPVKRGLKGSPTHLWPPRYRLPQRRDPECAGRDRGRNSRGFRPRHGGKPARRQGLHEV